MKILIFKNLLNKSYFNAVASQGAVVNKDREISVFSRISHLTTILVHHIVLDSFGRHYTLLKEPVDLTTTTLKYQNGG